MALIILSILGILCLYFVVILYQTIGVHFKEGKKEVLGFLIGLVSDFFDTLGIGSFMISTAAFNGTKFLENPRYLPGTLLVMHALPTLVEALFFITMVKVESLTLILLVVAAVLGSLIGSRVTVKLDKKKIQIIAGIAMLVTGFLMIAKNLGWLDALGQENTAMGLHGLKLVIGTVGNFILGILMSCGIGLYAPCMVMVYLLGLNPLAAFPIMMTSCAALMPTSGVTFIRKGLFQKDYLWAMILGGIIGVLIAGFFVKSLSLTALSWLVVFIGFLTTYSLFASALKKD